MNKLYDTPVSSLRVIFGLVLIFCGFLNLSFGFLPFLAPYSLLLASLIAFLVTYSLKGTAHLFSKPENPFRNFFLFLLAAFILSFVTSFLLVLILKLDLKANDLSGNIPWLQLPFMLLGEELFSFYVLIISLNFLQKNPQRMIIATLLSAFVFAIFHMLTYWNGSFLLTLIHVLLLQGCARILFNAAGVRSNSLYVPWIIHIVFDLITLGAISFL